MAEQRTDKMIGRAMAIGETAPFERRQRSVGDADAIQRAAVTCRCRLPDDADDLSSARVHLGEQRAQGGELRRRPTKHRAGWAPGSGCHGSRGLLSRSV